MIYDIPTLTSEAIGLLKSLIAIPSLSRDEEKAADYLQNYIEMQGMATGRKGNNVWCLSPMFDLKKPTLLLNSHIDTVKPVNGWRKDPFKPTLESNGKLYGLGVLVDRDRSVLRAGGYLIQLLPGAPDGVIDRLEKGIMTAGPVTNLLMENDDPESLLRRVMKDFELEILETVPVEYRCYCSRDRVCKALISLGAEELEEMVREQDGAELNCQFCGKTYRFAGAELTELAASLKK